MIIGDETGHTTVERWRWSSKAGKRRKQLTLIPGLARVAAVSSDARLLTIRFRANVIGAPADTVAVLTTWTRKNSPATTSFCKGQLTLTACYFYETLTLKFARLVFLLLFFTDFNGLYISKTTRFLNPNFTAVMGSAFCERCICVQLKNKVRRGRTSGRRGLGANVLRADVRGRRPRGRCPGEDVWGRMLYLRTTRSRATKHKIGRLHFI